MGDDHFMRPDNDMTKQMASPATWMQSDFRQLLDDVLDASHEYEVSEVSRHMKARDKYLEAKSRLLTAIASAMQAKFDLGYMAAGGAVYPLKKDVENG